MTQPTEPLLLSKTERQKSLLALDGIRMGLSASAKAIAMAPGQRTAAGDVVPMRKEDVLRMLQSSFALADFAAEMVRQLTWLEATTGVTAEPQDTPAYGGVALPPGTTELVIEDDTLFAVVNKPSTLMPGQTVKDKIAVVKVGAKDEEGTEVTMEDLRTVVDSYRKATQPRVG